MMVWIQSPNSSVDVLREGKVIRNFLGVLEKWALGERNSRH